MPGRRTVEHFPVQNSLDFPYESKMPMAGTFNSHELMIAFLGPIILGLVTMVILLPFISFGGITSILVYWLILPRMINRLKKSRKKSWMFDLSHRYRLGFLLMLIGASRHFRRPRDGEVYAARRGLIAGGWTDARRSLLVPTRVWHLTFALPPIRLWIAKSGTWSRPLAAARRDDGYCLLVRTYRPSARRIPEYLRHAELALDERGQSMIQNFERTLIPWSPRA